MSDSVEELYQQLLDLGMSEEELEKKVKNKVEEYGGFMSKQGVLFIIPINVCPKISPRTLRNRYKELSIILKNEEDLYNTNISDRIKS